jgi:hypothetical protein
MERLKLLLTKKKKKVDHYYFDQVFLLMLSNMNFQRNKVQNNFVMYMVMKAKGHPVFDSYWIFFVSGG